MTKNSVLITLFVFLLGCSEPPQPSKKSPTRQAPTHLIETQPVQLNTASTQQFFTGTIQAKQRVRLFNQEEGLVQTLSVDLGDHVTKDQTLLEINTQLLNAEMAKAIANTKKARADLKRINKLHVQKLASDLEKTQADTAMNLAIADQNILKLRLKNTRIKAPFSGVIIERPIEQGNIIAKFTHCLTLIDPNQLWVKVDVSEMLLPYIHIGDKPQIKTLNTNQIITGKVVKKRPLIDPISKQGLIEIQLDNNQETLIIGQSVGITLTIPALSKLTIPFAALQRDHTSEYVFTVKDGKATKTAVTSGQFIGNQVEILTGLTESQQVISKGFVGLKTGQNVKQAP